MILDFHVHTFPEHISRKAVEELGKNAGIEPIGDGSLASLKKHMAEYGIDYAVNQPVATRPDQVVSINRRSIENAAKEKNVIFFGAMHPQFGDAMAVDDELKFLKSKGIKGIKMHPEYQEFYPDDPIMAPVYESCQKHGLILLMHGGRDIAFTTYRATPARLAEASRYKELKLVIAHMGGFRAWDDVEHYLMGKNNIWFDTGFTGEMENWQMKEIIMGHGPFQILFGSDFPWYQPPVVISKIRELALGRDFEDMILYRNAARLLGMPEFPSR